MSAYVVDRNHIAYLVTSAIELARLNGCNSFRWTGPDGERNELAPGDKRGANRAGQMLWDENIRSVLYRYPQDTRETMPGPIGEDFKYRHDFQAVWEFNAAAVIKSCHCWAYQTCETPDHENTAAWAFVDALQRAAASHVQGYSSAPWGAPKPSPMVRIW